jgi:tetratricopeptide (TPR) repeat protein
LYLFGPFMIWGSFGNPLKNPKTGTRRVSELRYRAAIVMQRKCTSRDNQGDLWRALASVALLCGLLMGTGTARAQGPPLPLARLRVLRDSLGQLLGRNTRPDTLRVSRLNTLAFALRVNEAEESLVLTRQALRLARQLQFERGLLEAQFNLSYYHRAHSQYDSAIYYARQALPLADRIGNRYTQTRVLYNLARSYQEQGDYAAALGPSLDGLALARAMGSPRVLLFQLVMAARIELALGEYATARAYMAEARPLASAAHDLLSTGYLYQVAGDLSRQQKQWRTARDHYTQALNGYAVVFNKPGLLQMQLSIAEMTERLGDYPAARRAGLELLRQARIAHKPEQEAQAALLMARAWLLARPDSAHLYAALSLATARPRHLRPQARDAAQVLAQASDPAAPPAPAGPRCGPGAGPGQRPPRARPCGLPVPDPGRGLRRQHWGRRHSPPAGGCAGPRRTFAHPD